LVALAEKGSTEVSYWNIQVIGRGQKRGGGGERSQLGGSGSMGNKLGVATGRRFRNRPHTERTSPKGGVRVQASIACINNNIIIPLSKLNSATKNDSIILKWISHKNQSFAFFNSKPLISYNVQASCISKTQLPRPNDAKLKSFFLVSVKDRLSLNVFTCL
jgi:hypothetical protein